MKPDPYDNPTRNTAVMQNLVGNMRLIHVMPFLQEITFDQLVEYWWAAKRLQADELERQTARR